MPLAKELLQKELISIGTLRANKKEIPKEFIGNKKKTDPGTTLYGFSDGLMLVSWTPKKNKTILFLSTDNSVLPEIGKHEKKQSSHDNDSSGSSNTADATTVS